MKKFEPHWNGTDDLDFYVNVKMLDDEFIDMFDLLQITKDLVAKMNEGDDEVDDEVDGAPARETAPTTKGKRRPSRHERYIMTCNAEDRHERKLKERDAHARKFYADTSGKYYLSKVVKGRDSHFIISNTLPEEKLAGYNHRRRRSEKRFTEREYDRYLAAAN